MTDATDEVQSFQILCRPCATPIQTLPGSAPEMWGCPACGVQDTPQAVEREVHAHTQELMAQAAQKALSGGARGSKFLKFTPQRLRRGSYRFVSDLKL